MASSLEDDASAKTVISNADIVTERPGSDRYKQTHMALIFQQGLSFSGFERNKTFMGGAGMRFTDISDVTGADSEMDCRASLIADFDDDGDPDIFVNSVQREQHMLFRNDAGVATRNGFVKIRLRATSGHPDAIGAIVKLRRKASTQAQVLSCGSGFESQNSLELIYGLGADQQAEISVLWPGRQLESFGSVKAGGRFLLVEGSGKPKPYAARSFEFRDPMPPGLKFRVGDEMSELMLRTAGGEKKVVSLRAEKKTLVNFWATTCASCVAELPELGKLHDAGTYRVVGVSMDFEAMKPGVLKLWNKLGLKFDTFFIDDKAASKYFDLPRLGIPLTVIIDSSGRVEKILQGQLRPGDL